MRSPRLASSTLERPIAPRRDGAAGDRGAVDGHVDRELDASPTQFAVISDRARRVIKDTPKPDPSHSPAASSSLRDVMPSLRYVLEAAGL